MKWTEKIIIKALASKFLEMGHPYVCSNTMSIGGGSMEIDFLTINKGGFSTEVEIKCSHNDFKADFKKQKKHRHLQGKEYVKYTDRSGSPVFSDGVPHVNYFYYACPEHLIPLAEVPDYAGLIHVHYCEHPKGIYVDIIKRAPRLKTDPVSEKLLGNMYRSIMLKYYKLL